MKSADASREDKPSIHAFTGKVGERASSRIVSTNNKMEFLKISCHNIKALRAFT